MNILQLMPNRNNSPFDNFVRNNYVPQTPQNRLQTAYNQAMKQRTPEWARTVSDMMPSIAEMVAYGTTKGAFNQGRIVDSLEREKQRRTAYNQMMRENEDKQVNDYVQMAKEQLGMDMALDDRERAKENAQIQRDTQRDNTLRAYNLELNKLENLKEQQRIANDRAEAEAEERRKQQALDNKHRDRMFKLTEDKMKADQDAAKQEVNKEEQKNVTEMQKSVSELQAQLNSFDKEIPELEQLNKESHMGAVGRTISGVGGGLGNLFGVKDNKFIEPELKNQEKVARLRQKALGMLKTTFGGAVSEGERDAIFAQFGLDKDNMNYKEYENAIKLMRAYFQNKLNEKQETLNLYTNQNSVNWEKQNANS